MTFFIIALVFATILLLTSVKIIKEHEQGVLFTLGQYTATRDAGIQIVIPTIQNIIVVDTREQTEETDGKNIITQDGLTININATISYKVVNSEHAINEVQDYKAATKAAVEKSIKNDLGRFDQDEIFETRHEIKQDMQTRLNAETKNWGVQITDLDINFKA